MYDILEVNDHIYDDYYPKECIIDFTIPKTSHAVPVLIYFHGGDLESGSRKEKFIRSFAAEHGIAVASVDYRTYPYAQYPDFINDGARACEYVWNFGNNTGLFNSFFVGGSSAGAYIAMMLYFCADYLKEFVLSPDRFDGFLFDGGQPTTHYNVLKELCIDHRAIRIDRAAPIYYIDTPPSSALQRPPVLISFAEKEKNSIGAQNELLWETMLSFGYKKVERVVMNGFGHGEYRTKADQNGNYPINKVFGEFITKNLKENCKQCD